MYTYKRLEELAWFGAVAVAWFVLELAADFCPETIQDWETYAKAVGGGAVRTFAAAILANIRK